MTNPKSSILREKLKEATSQEILAAAESVLATEGFQAASMLKVAQTAGVSVGTLYNYFKDKDELLGTLILERRTSFHQMVDAALVPNEGETFAAQLARLVGDVLKSQDSHRSVLRIIFEQDGMAIKAGTPHATAMKLIDRFRPFMQRGVEEGVLAKTGADLYAAILAGMIRGVLIEWVSNDKRSYSEAAETVVGVFLNGARS